MKRAILAGVVLLWVFAFAVAGQAAPGWAPSKPIEFIVPASPGGGSDVLARTMVSIIEAEKLCPVPFVVMNRPGATIGNTTVAQARGNPHILMTYHSGQMVAPYIAGVEFGSYRDMTMLANIAIDEQLIVVKADSPFKTMKDLVSAAKERTVTVGGTQMGMDDHMCNRLVERAANVKLRYVPFNSGGECMTALLGGHVDFIWANPAEFAPQMEAKQVRPLGVAREERIPYMPDVLTFKEQGYNVTWKMFRAIVTAPDLSREMIAFYENMLKRMTESSKWKEGYLKRYMLTPAWMGSQEFTQSIGPQEQLSKGILKELGIIK